MKYFISLFFLFYTSLILAESKIDSLKKIINESNNDSLKIEALNQLSIHYEFSSDLENAAKYHKQRVLLLQKSPNPKGLGDIYNYIGRQHYYKQVYDSATYYFEKSAGYFEKANFKKGIISARNNIAAIYSEQGKIKRSIKEHHKLIALNKGKDYDPYNLASSYANLGYCYMESSFVDSSIYYFTKSARLNKANNYLTSLATNYFNLASLNFNLKFYDKSLGYLDEIGKNKLPLKNNLLNSILYLKSSIYINTGFIDSAMKYVFMCKTHCKTTGDNLTLLSALINEANCYLSKKNYVKSKVSLEQGLSLSIEVGAKHLEGTYYKEFGKLFMELNKNKDAIQNFEKAISIAKENGNSFEIKYILKELASSYAKLGDFKTSTMLLDSLVRYNESINVLETFKATKELEEQYLSEKKDAQIKLQEKDIEEKKKQNQLQQYALWLGAFVIIIVTFLAYIAFKNYQKSKKQNIIIEKQKTEVEEKQKEIISSINYAKRIQHSLMPTKSYLDKKIKSD